MVVLVLKRYRPGDSKGNQASIERAEIAGVVLTDNEGIPIHHSVSSEDPIFKAMVKRLHGKAEMVKIRRKGELIRYQPVIRQSGYAYFLELSDLIVD